MQAKGTFEVTITPQPDANASDGVELGSAGIQKQFQGDLQGSSAGRMLFASTPEPGSKGYVAIERVTGSLAGKRGSFVLQHDGLMNRGTSSLTIHVVPDSATGELSGLHGGMRIEVREGTHYYDFDYEL